MKEVQLTGGAAEWVERCLSYGSTLARLLLDSPISGGHIWTYLPADVDVHEASRSEILKHGKKDAITAGHVEEISDMVAGFVTRHLRRSGKPYAVLEDISRPGDPAISSPDEQLFFYHSEVYDFLGPKDRDIDIRTVRWWLSKGRPYPTVLVLTAAADIPDICHQQEVLISLFM